MEKIIEQDSERVSFKYFIITILSLLTLKKVSKLEVKRKNLQDKINRLYNNDNN